MRFDSSLEELDPKYRKRSESGKSVIYTDYAVPKKAGDFISELLSEYHADSVAFVIHVLLSHRSKDPWGVPIPRRTIRKTVRKAEKEIPTLIQEGILERSPEYGPGNCYEYRIGTGIRREFFQRFSSEDLNDIVNPVPDQPLPEPDSTSLHDENKNYYPNPLRSALKALKYGRFNKSNIDKLLERRRDELRRIDLQSKDPKLNYNEKMGSLARAQYLQFRLENDERCYSTLIKQNPIKRKAQIYDYLLAYRVVSTGRIAHIGGGLQSCSREMKAAAYEGLEGIHNYDIKSSQASIVQALMSASGYDTGWLDEYLESEKEQYASSVGISKEAWKRCLYAILFGAQLSLSRDIEGGYYTIGEILSGDEEDKMRSTREKFEALEEVIGPFYKEVEKWRKHLVKTWLPANKTNSRAGWSVKNDAGVSLNKEVFESWGGRKRRAKLASFVLQGKEASFIHTLTGLLPEHDVIPISNEHDGLVTIGAISEEVVETAKNMTNMPYVNLELKSFV